jgi:VWFA-related protein
MTATLINGAKRQSYSPVLKYYDKDSDTAVLKVAGQGFDFFAVAQRPVRVGERVYAIGNPEGLEQSMTDGIVSGIREDGGTRWIQHSAPISHGSSGGALVSSRGELLGINSFLLKESQNLNFAVPAATLVRALSNAKKVGGFFSTPPDDAGQSHPQTVKDEPVTGPVVLDLQQSRQRVRELENQIANISASPPPVKDLFESSAEYNKRRQVWSAQQEQRIRPLRAEIDDIKNRFYADSAVSTFVTYDADAEMLTASISGGNHVFNIPRDVAKKMHDSWSGVTVARKWTEEAPPINFAISPLDVFAPTPTTTFALVWQARDYIEVSGSPSQAKTQEPTLAPEVSLKVRLTISVTDDSGHAVTKLPEKAFRVFEDGVPQQIMFFREEDAPVSMALLLDSSRNVSPSQHAVASQALMMVLNDSNPRTEAFVVNFNDETYLDVDFTSNMEVLKTGLARIDAKGGTAMRDAIRMSIDHLHDKAKRDKKVVIVMTGGDDDASMITPESLVKLAQQDNTLIYAIGLLGGEGKTEATEAKHALNSLAESTGGRAFYPKDMAEMGRAAREIATEIHSQYQITYWSENTKRNSTFRSIKVLVSGQGNPVAHTRLGYWATKENISGYY